MIPIGIALVCFWLVFIQRQLVRIADALERLEVQAVAATSGRVEEETAKAHTVHFCGNEENEMSRGQMSRGQRTEDGGQRTGAIGNGQPALRLAQGGPDAAALGRALVAGVDRLHAERGELVLQARDLRLKGEHAEREAVWERVQEITLQIEQSEADIASFGGRGALAGGPSASSGQAGVTALLRDPDAELPDDDTTVVAVIEPTDDESYVENLYFSDAGWRYAETRSPLMSSELAFGWMHVREAVEVLRKAVRHG